MKARHSVRSVLLMVCLVQPLAPIWAQANRAPTNLVPSNPATETVSGRIIVKADGLPPQKNTRIWIFDEKSGKEYTAPVDVKGEFTVTLPEGYYVVLIASLGFNPYAKEISLEHGKPVKLMVKQDPDAAVWDSYVTCCR